MSNASKAQNISIHDLYGDLGMSEAKFYALLDKSLAPRGPDLLYEKLSSHDIQKDHLVLDIGCRDAAHAIRLAKKFGVHVIAIDPLSYNIKKARKLVQQRKLGSKISLIQGNIEELRLKNNSIDFVWARDMLNHVPNLKLGFRECARVLKPGGKMLIFVNLATELLEPQELKLLCDSLSTVPWNMSKKNLESAILGAKLQILECDRISSEWREWGFEQGEKIAYTAQQLLRIARMRRNREFLIKKIGIKNYLCELADCHWGVYTMLGKLCPYLYVLQKKRTSRGD